MAHELLSGPIVAGIGADGAGAHAARRAAALGQSLGVPVILVFGYDISQLGPRGGPLEEQLAAIAGEVTDEVHAQLAAEFPDVAISVELVRDRPVDSLIRAAEIAGAQMIVVGHGGSGPLRAALLGSTAYEIVHRGEVPVLVVPDPDDDESDDSSSSED